MPVGPRGEGDGVEEEVEIAHKSYYGLDMFRTKICGVTTPGDAAMIADAGADAIGMNFYPRSPRFVDRDTADRILKDLSFRCLTIGVFVGHFPPITMPLAAVQTYCEPPIGHVVGIRHIPAFRIQGAADFAQI